MTILSTYNDDPPSDDGSETAGNTVSWSKIKEELTDPLKNWIDSPDFDGNASVKIDADADSYWDYSTDDTAKLYLGGTLAATFATTGLTVEAGAWITPTFSSGDFTANGSMTWTVASGDVTTYAYKIDGKTMHVMWAINTSTVGGTPSTELRIAIPASKVVAKTCWFGAIAADNGSGRAAAQCYVAASGTTINIERDGVVNWSASTDNTSVYGQITFEIN